MKKQKNTFVIFLFLAVLALFSTSCETVEDQCNSMDDMEKCEAQFTLCTSENESYYEYAGEKFYCEDVYDCDQAMADVLEASGCSTKATALDVIIMKERTITLMNQLRSSVVY